MVWLLLRLMTTAIAADDTGDAGVDPRDTGELGCEDGDAPQTWYDDEDGDGWGALENATEACEPPDDAVTRAGDCDDEAPDRFPGADERCDGVDTDCDGQADPTWCSTEVPLAPGTTQGCDCRGTGGTFGLAAVALPWWRRRRVTAA